MCLVYNNDQRNIIMTKSVWSDFDAFVMYTVYKKIRYTLLWTAFFHYTTGMFNTIGSEKWNVSTGICKVCGLLVYVYRPFFQLWTSHIFAIAHVGWHSFSFVNSHLVRWGRIQRGCHNVFQGAEQLTQQKNKVIICITGCHIPVVYQSKTVISVHIQEHILFAP